MSVSVGSIVLNVRDVDRAAKFWSHALGYAAQDSRPGFLSPRDSACGPCIHLDETDKTHIDLWVEPRRGNWKAEVDRLISLGAQPVEWDYPEDADFVVLADPDGNTFCVVN